MEAKPDPSTLDLTTVDWQTSSYTGGGGECVRVGEKDGYVLIGDTKNPGRVPQIYTRSEIRAFLLGVRDGEFDRLL
ncbi:DUF397 domain-containing protein [Streptomyces sp. NPDC054796]